MLERIGFTTYQTNGNLVELANLISIARTLRLRGYEDRPELTHTDRELFRKLAKVVECIERREGD